MTNTTVSSTYYLPSGGINGTNPVGIVTTSTTFEKDSTPPSYENATFVYGSTSTCTVINSHYNMTQTVNGSFIFD